MKKFRTLFTLFLMVFVAGSIVYGAEVYYGQANLNTATFDELVLLPYVNGEIANNIIEFRNNNGPFSSIDDLLKVEGITKKALKEMKPYLKLEGKTDIERIVI
jgi:competence protein ComEA